MNVKELFKYTPDKNYNFSLKSVNNNDVKEYDSEKKISSSIDLNLKLLTARNTRI